MDQIKKLNDFISDISKDKYKQKDLEMDVTYKNIQLKNVVEWALCKSCIC